MKVKTLLFLVLMSLAGTATVSAETGYQTESEPAGPEPPPTAPINNWIPLAAVLGVASAGFVLVKRNLKTQD